MLTIQHFFSIAIALLLVHPLATQTRHIERQNWKMGFVDASGNTIISAEYDFLPWKYASRIVARLWAQGGVQQRKAKESDLSKKSNVIEIIKLNF